MVTGVGGAAELTQHARNMHRLRDDFAGGEVARVTHLTGGAKHTAHRTADLARDARGHAAGETHEHGFDAFAVGEFEQIFAREAVARVGLDRSREHTDP